MHPALWGLAGGLAYLALSNGDEPQDQDRKAPEAASDDPGEGGASEDPTSDPDPSHVGEGKSPTPDRQSDAREQTHAAERAGEEARKRWQAQVGTPRVEGPQERPTRSEAGTAIEDGEAGQSEAGASGETGPHESESEDPTDPED